MKWVAKWVSLSVFLVLTIAVASCSLGGAKELTRAQAASLIESSAEFLEVKSKLYLHKDGLDKGQKQGMWVPSFGTSGLKGVNLTPQGQQFFQSVQLSNSGFYVIPKNPVKVSLKVPGMESGQGSKEAQFTWEYVDLPSIVKRYVVRGGSGTAVFRLYDDGWRLEDLLYDYSTEPASLTEKELAAE